MTTISKSTQSPRDLLLTVFGLFGRDAGTGRTLSIGSLVRLLGDQGVDEPAARSAVSRMKRRGLLEPGPVAVGGGSRAGYRATPPLLEVFAEGDRRIFRPPAAGEVDLWLLVVFSVPEAERSRRHALRARLARLGFGTVAPGVWIAPAVVEPELRASLHRADVDGYVSLFTATPARLASASSIGDWWSLPAIDTAYRAFLGEVGSIALRWRRAEPDGAAACADDVRLVTAWRELPFLDPGLPASLLPPGWPGRAAAERFLELHARLEQPAHAYVATLDSASAQSRQ